MVNTDMIFHVPGHWRVFVLDDTEDRLRWFRERMPQMHFATTATAALEVLSTEHFDLVFLDHDLSFMGAGFPERLHGNGKEVARYLARTNFAGRIVIYSRSEQPSAMAKILPQATVSAYGDFDIILQKTAQKPTRGTAGSD
jgi:CheY-like chemotaxis protein